MSESFKKALRGKKGAARCLHSLRDGEFLKRCREMECQAVARFLHRKLLENVESSTDGDDVSGVYISPVEINKERNETVT
ncbi:hypothetical protein CEXT_435431 [Caerostris extrusa]|uniref:Uncharacterized protein n=1 Tax=Caerostris extrusa TaxID=172846 RepID=A0AAV4RGU1_CAEEX|nr:hypothetical protein CEXT_435431 [Caerostris extrusa]